jgi:hypothetical protein
MFLRKDWTGLMTRQIHRRHQRTAAFPQLLSSKFNDVDILSPFHSDKHQEY